MYQEFLARAKPAEAKLAARTALSSMCDTTPSYLTGCGRRSMLSVQAITVFPGRDGVTSTVFGERSNRVSYSPGTFQLLPCGYFESFESGGAAVLADNCDPIAALLREYLEELFGLEEVIANDGRPLDFVYGHPEALDLRARAEKSATGKVGEGGAIVEFVGSVFDLVTLTHKLSFLVAINDYEYWNKEIVGNFETRQLCIVPVSELTGYVDGARLMPESAGLISLALASQTMRSLLV